MMKGLRWVFLFLVVFLLVPSAWAQDHFVKVGGSDANDGHTWANAKANPSSAFAAATGTGDRVIIAPGRYGITAAIAPSAAGTRENPKAVIGDYNSDISDGTATSGIAAGYVILDASNASTGQSDIAIFTRSVNWPYWNIKGLFFCGGGKVWVDGFTGSGATVSDSITIEDCISINAEAGFVLSQFKPNPDADPTYRINIKNCIFIGGQIGLTIEGIEKSTAFYTNPQVIIDRVYAFGTWAGLNVPGDASRYQFVEVYNSTLVSNMYSAVYASSAAIRGVSATYSKVNVYDSLLYALAADIAITSTYTRSKKYLHAATSDLSSEPLLPPMALLYPSSPLIDVAGTASRSSVDIWANVQQGADWDVGVQEYLSDQFPKKPTMILPVPGSGGGGGTSFGFTN